MGGTTLGVEGSWGDTGLYIEIGLNASCRSPIRHITTFHLYLFFKRLHFGTSCVLTGPEVLGQNTSRLHALIHTIVYLYL